MCVSGVDYRGYCASATGNGAPDTAIWCDPATGQTFVVSCAARGQTCQVDACADGAYCCDSATTVDMAQPPAMNAECDALGYGGECRPTDTRAGARAARSRHRLRDARADLRRRQLRVGRLLLRHAAAAPATSECDTLGIAGVCTGDGHARWCSGGQIDDVDCGAAGQTCQVDTCATGAYCCD